MTSSKWDLLCVEYSFYLDYFSLIFCFVISCLWTPFYVLPPCEVIIINNIITIYIVFRVILKVFFSTRGSLGKKIFIFFRLMTIWPHFTFDTKHFALNKWKLRRLNIVKVKSNIWLSSFETPFRVIYSKNKNIIVLISYSFCSILLPLPAELMTLTFSRLLRFK